MAIVGVIAVAVLVAFGQLSEVDRQAVQLLHAPAAVRAEAGLPPWGGRP